MAYTSPNRDHLPHYLMTGDDRQLWRPEIAFSDVQICVANPARKNLKQELPRAGLRLITCGYAQRRSLNFGWLAQLDNLQGTVLRTSHET